MPLVLRLLLLSLFGARTLAGAPETLQLVYPQLAIGGGFQSLLQLTNPGPAPWSGTLRVPEFAIAGGVSWRINGQDLSGEDSLPLELGSWETRRYILDRTPGEGPVSGSLWIASEAGANLPASAFFYRFELEGRLIDEVSAPAAAPSRRIAFPVEVDASLELHTGVAVRFADPGTLPAAEAAEPSFRALLVSAEGLLLETADGLQPGANFLEDWFTHDLGVSFLGSVILEADQPFYATVLHQRLLGNGEFQLTGVQPSATLEAAPATETARYRVRFDATWSSSTHPDSFPLGAHFSPLIGATHSAGVVFWEPGGLATNGIQQMAELGQTEPLSLEVQTAIEEGTAASVVSGGGTSSPGFVTLEFSIHRDFPLVTLVSMVAPSPDWFVGVSGLPLFENGEWVDQLSVDLRGMDAGTDSGTSYSSPDQPTLPHVPISELSGPPFLNQGMVLPFGTFLFTRIDDP